jgi:hypothetical protein
VVRLKTIRDGLVVVKFNRARLDSTGTAEKVVALAEKNEGKIEGEINHIIDFFKRNELISVLAAR